MSSRKELLESLLKGKLPDEDVKAIVQEVFPEVSPMCLFLMTSHPAIERAIEDVAGA